LPLFWRLFLPTIGIGAGAGCDGQVLVISDMLGLFTDFVPKHVKQYAKLADVMSSAIAEYHNEVKAGQFPTEAQSFFMDEGIIAELAK
jgi:3-methyl-2-oxobutanoate hydroxymethyltransferase